MGDALAKSPRWRVLAEHVASFYEKGLTDDDGAPEKELREVEHRLRCRLPRALAELHRLCGKRLRPSGHYLIVPLARLGTPRVAEVWGVEEAAGLAFAGDYGGPSWIACVSPDDLKAQTPDPAVSIEGRKWAPPLSELLTGFVLEDTLASLCAGHDQGPLGPFAPDVAAGSTPEGAERLLAELPRLLPTGRLDESFTTDLLGGKGMLVQVTGRAGSKPTSYTWAAATPDARKRFVPAQPGPVHDGIVRLSGLTKPQVQNALIRYEAATGRLRGPPPPDLTAAVARLHSGLAPKSQLAGFDPSPDEVLVQFRSYDLSRDVPVLRDFFGPKVEIGVRALGAARYRGVFPEGTTRFGLRNRYRDVDVFA